MWYYLQESGKSRDRRRGSGNTADSNLQQPPNCCFAETLCPPGQTEDAEVLRFGGDTNDTEAQDFLLHRRESGPATNADFFSNSRNGGVLRPAPVP